MSKPSSLTAYVPETTVAKVRRMAERERRSVSYVTAELVEEAIEARELQRIGADRKPERRK